MSRLFWLLATAYAVIVLVIVLLTAPDLRRDGLAALPAMTLTLPTSMALMVLSAGIAPEAGVGVFISVSVLSAMFNIGIAYVIARWYGGRRATSHGKSQSPTQPPLA